MRLLLALLVLTASASASRFVESRGVVYLDPFGGTAYQLARCGLNAAFNPLCGAVTAAPALSAPTSINACDTVPGTPQRITAGGNYILANNLVAATNAKCLTWSVNGVKLDLGGFIVTGRLNGTNEDDAIIQNGTVNCNFPDSGADAGCVLRTLRVAATAPVQLLNVTVRNAAAAARGYRIENNGVSTYSGTWPQVVIKNADGLSASDPTGIRWTNLDITGAIGGTELTDSKITCAADTAACQGLMCYNSQNCWAHNNRMIMVDNTTSETGRAFLADAQAASCGTGADNMLVFNNLIEVNDNRAFRIRCSRGGRFFNNIVVNVLSNGSGAIHLGDADAGEDLPNMDFQAYNNTYSVGTGIVVFLRNGSGATFRDETVTCATPCTSGTFSFVRTPSAPGTLSTLTLMNIRGVAGIGFTTENDVWAGATVNYCNSGTATGAGTKTAISCP